MTREQFIIVAILGALLGFGLDQLDVFAAKPGSWTAMAAENNARFSLAMPPLHPEIYWWKGENWKRRARENLEAFEAR